MDVMHLLKQLLPLLPSGPSAITNDLWLMSDVKYRIINCMTYCAILHRPQNRLLKNSLNLSSSATVLLEGYLISNVRVYKSVGRRFLYSFVLTSTSLPSNTGISYLLSRLLFIFANYSIEVSSSGLM